MPAKKASTTRKAAAPKAAGPEELGAPAASTTGKQKQGLEGQPLNDTITVQPAAHDGSDDADAAAQVADENWNPFKPLSPSGVDFDPAPTTQTSSAGAKTAGIVTRRNTVTNNVRSA